MSIVNLREFLFRFFNLKVLLGLGGAIIVALSVIMLLGRSPATSQFSFNQNQKVAISSDLQLRFPFAMDRDSVEENLNLPANLSGQLKWLDDQTLIFDPTEDLTFKAVYKFKLGRRALRSNGQRIGKILEFKFTASGMPTLATHAPADETAEIPIDAEITLVFDRPIIALSAVHSKKNPENWMITITPETQGRWRWLGTTTVKFMPSEELKPATRYTVSVPAGLKTLSGEQTVEDFSFSFETIRPRVVDTTPRSDSNESGPNSKIELSFNLPIDIVDAREKITLSASKEGHPLNIKNIVYGEEEVDGQIVVDEKTIIVTPDEPLMFNSYYSVKVAPDIHSTIGELGSAAEYVLNFLTAGPMFITKGKYRDNRISFQFSNELKEKTLAGKISITPLVEGWEELTFEPNQWSRDRLSFYLGLHPSTTYTLTVDQDVRDRWGQNLPGDYELTFTTKSIDPKVFIHSEGEFGFFESTKPPIYYLNAINVSRMDMELAKLSLPEFLEIRKKEHNNGHDFEPNLSDYTNHQKWSFPPPKNKHDEWESIPFDVSEEATNKLSSGIYVLTLKAPEYRRQHDDRRQIINYQYFALTNIGLTLKYSGEQALVWAIDLQTGDPLQNVLIKFNSLSGDQIITGRTNIDGFFETKFDLQKFITTNNNYQPEFWVTAEHEKDFAFIGSNWTNGIRPYNFGFGRDFHGTNSPDYRMHSYIYTERPVYRPGDTVYFKGVVRLRDAEGALYPPNGSRQALVKIEDAKGNEIYNKTLDFTKFGSFSGELPLDDKAALGGYYLSAQILPDHDIGNNYGSADFSVLAYRKPEYRVDLSATAEEYFDKDNIEIGVEGAYYFGAPLSNAKVNWRAKTTDYFFNRYTDGWYSFALEDSWCWWDCERQSSLLLDGTGELDENGKFNLEFLIDLADKSVGQVVTVEADITDPNNQVVSGRVSIPVHKSNIYIGIRPESYSVQPGEDAKLKIVAVTPSGELIDGQKVVVKLFSREWNSVRKKNVDGRYYYDNEAKDTFVGETSVKTNSDGKAIAKLKVPSGGQYRAIAIAEDAEGRESKAGTSIYAWSRTYVNWSHKNDDKIDVIADKPEYAVGDVAKLLVKSPYQGENVKALITVERENVIRKEVVNIESNAQSFEIPITEDLIPNAYVSVIVIKPRVGETFNEHGLDTGAPAFKIGYAKLLVETKRKKLNLTLTTDKKKYGPGETVQVQLKAADYIGEPVESELSLSVVDMSVLALTGFEMPDLVKRFYAERGLGVTTSELLTYLLERFKPGSKGGGGADPESKKRGDFRDTAYWNPAIETDENGEAKVEFKLPDNLTTWKLLTIANTQTSEFGATAEEIVETKKVIVRPVRPRFAVTGDQIKLGAIIHNFLDKEAEFSVSLTGFGFESTGETKQIVKVAAGEQAKINFPIVVDRAENLTLNFLAETDGARDEIEEVIPVYEFGTPQSVATSGLTEDIITEILSAPSRADASSGDLSITVSPTLATYLPAGLDYLVKFPYGCAEQTVSSFLPNVAIAQLQGFDAFKITTDEELEKNISSGLGKLYTFQRGDGGFGYWAGSRESYPYLTSYIVFALNETKKAGYAVDTNVISRARNYINSILRSQNLREPISLANRAYILFVLAESGNVDVGLLNNLYDQREDLPLFSRAQLAMALRKSGFGGGRAKSKKILDEIIGRVKTETRGAHFEEDDSKDYRTLMHTNSRTTATVLQALVRIDPDNALIPRIVRYLLAIREDGHWDTTQSTTISILSLVEFLKSTGELNADMTAGVQVGNKQVLDHGFDQTNILTQESVRIALAELAQGEDNEIKIGKEGAGRLYYDLLLSYFYTADELPPAEEGLGIIRELQPLQSNESDASLTEAKLGETYKVRLTITVPNDRHFVAVESPLPAGMEAIDTNLKTSQQGLLDEAIMNCEHRWSYDCWRNNIWRFNHTELRDDKVFLFADYLPTGVYEYEYLVRATTPGRFRLRPARTWEMYFPETFGQTGGNWFDIKE